MRYGPHNAARDSAGGNRRGVSVLLARHRRGDAFAGGDVNLVERSICRMGAAHGAVDMNVFAITSFMVATMTMPDGSEVTQGATHRQHGLHELRPGRETRQAVHGGLREPPWRRGDARTVRGNRKAALPPFRALPRRHHLHPAASRCSSEEARSTASSPPSSPSSSACSWTSSSASPPNNIVFNFATALVAGLLIGAIAHRSGVSTDMVIIGDIMLLIPGVAMTNAARDMLAGKRSRASCASSRACCGRPRWQAASWWPCGRPTREASFISPTRHPRRRCRHRAGHGRFRSPRIRPALQPSRLAYPAACVGGVLSWGIYLAGGVFVEGIFIPA